MSTPYKNTQKNTQKNAQKGLKTLWGGMAFRFDCNESTSDLYLVKNRISDYVFETEHREIDEDSLTKTIGTVTYEFDEDETFKVIPTSNLKEILKYMAEALPKSKDSKSQKRFLGYLITILKNEHKVISEGKRWKVLE